MNSHSCGIYITDAEAKATIEWWIIHADEILEAMEEET